MVTEREGQLGRHWTGNGEIGGRCKWGGRQGTETKRLLLLEDVLEYRESYKGEGAN